MAVRRASRLPCSRRRTHCDGFWRAGIERIGLPDAIFQVKSQDQDQTDNFSRPVSASNHTEAVGALMDWIEVRSGRDALTAVGHRVLQGGPKYYKPQRITAEMVAELRSSSVHSILTICRRRSC